MSHYDDNDNIGIFIMFLFGIVIGIIIFTGIDIFRNPINTFEDDGFKYNIGDNSVLSMVNNDLISFSFYESEYIVGLNYIDRDRLKKSFAMYVEGDQMYFQYTDIDCVDYLNIDCRKSYTYNLTNVSVY